MKYLYIFSISIFLNSCSGQNESYDNSESVESFKFEFQEAPTPDIKKIHAKQIVVGDACRAWLKFEAAKSFEEKLKEKGFHVISKQEFDLHSRGGNVPAWWTIDTSDGVIFYGFDHWNKNYTNSFSVFWYDHNSKLMYFCHDADS